MIRQFILACLAIFVMNCEKENCDRFYEGEVNIKNTLSNDTIQLGERFRLDLNFPNTANTTEGELVDVEDYRFHVQLRLRKYGGDSVLVANHESAFSSNVQLIQGIEVKNEYWTSLRDESKFYAPEKESNERRVIIEITPEEKGLYFLRWELAKNNSELLTGFEITGTDCREWLSVDFLNADSNYYSLLRGNIYLERYEENFKKLGMMGFYVAE